MCKNDISSIDERPTEGTEQTKEYKHCETLTTLKMVAPIKQNLDMPCRSCYIRFQLLYVGQAGDNRKKRFGQHKYDRNDQIKMSLPSISKRASMI